MDEGMRQVRPVQDHQRDAEIFCVIKDSSTYRKHDAETQEFAIGYARLKPANG